MMRLVRVLLVVALVASASLGSARAASAGGDEESTEDSTSAERTVDTVPNTGGGKVTLISNKNTLTHIASAPKVVNHFALEEQDRKSEQESGLKRQDEEKVKAKQEQFEKKEKAEEQKAKNELEEKEKKIQQEAASKKLEEEKAKAEIKLAEAKQKSDAQLAAATEAAAKAEAKKKQEEEAAKAAESKKEEGGKNEQRNKHAQQNNIDLAGYDNYHHSYATAAVSKWDRLCVVRGLVNRARSDHIGTLPGHCRPYEGRLIFNMFHGADTRIDVLADGRIYYVAGHIAAGWLSISGITFDTHRVSGVHMYNGWVSYGSGYREVTQSKFGELCVLSGLIRSGNWGAFAQMRGDCNPSGGQLIFSCNNHGSVTRVDVNTGGTVHYAGGSHNHGWVSLDGIVYTPHHGGNDLPLYSGWANYYSGYRPLRWQRTGSVCALSGLIRGSWGGYITQLPGGCRPGARLIFAANVHEYSGRIDVLPDGQVHFIQNHGRHGWISLSNIHFTAFN